MLILFYIFNASEYLTFGISNPFICFFAVIVIIFCIYKGSENQEPCIIYISGINKFGWVSANIVNTKTTIFPEISNEHILDLSEYSKLAELLRVWEIENHKRAIAHLENDTTFK